MTRIEDLEKKRIRLSRDYDEHEAILESLSSELRDLDEKIETEKKILAAGLMQGAGVRFDGQDAVIITFQRYTKHAQRPGASIELCVRDAAGAFFEIRLDYQTNAHRIESVPFDESVELFNEFRAAGKI